MTAQVEVALLVLDFEAMTAEVWVVGERKNTRARVARTGQNGVSEDEVSPGSAIGCREEV